jgi:DNA-binding transcriptional MocR family regulator
MSRLPNIQFVSRPRIIDLGWGHPDPDLLPTALISRAYSAAIARHGADALQYGYCSGPGSLLEWLVARIGEQEGRKPADDEIMITAGASCGLDLILKALARPGDSILVESPTYHLATRMLKDHQLDLVPVATDHDGIIVEELVARLRERNSLARPPRLLYTVSTFNNPTSVSLSEPRRRALVELAARQGLIIVEDDVYRELSYESAPPRSLWSMATGGVVARLGSFSKSLAPGLRLGWLTADSDLIRSITQNGLLDSGGGLNHFCAMAVSTLCEAGDYDAHIAHLISAYRARRDALVTSLAEYLPKDCALSSPQGGYFAWLTLPPGCSSDALLPYAESTGTSFLPGSQFDLVGRGKEQLRLSFSRYSVDMLMEATRRLGRAFNLYIETAAHS